MKRLWRGELPLEKAFWSWAVLGGLLVNATTTILFLALMTHDLWIPALLAGYGPSVPYNVVAMVGVWRAADRYPGERVWAETARIATVVGLAVLTVT